MSWTVDEDCVAVGFTSWVQSAVTRDPSALNSTYFAPGSVNYVSFDTIAFTGASAASSAKMIIIPKIPLFKGEVIYCTFNASGYSILYIDSVEANS